MSTSNTNTNESPNYDNLSLKELKAIAQERQIVPEGNKTKKDTWISALTEAEPEQSNTITSVSEKLVDEFQPEAKPSEFKIAEPSAEQPVDKPKQPIKSSKPEPSADEHETQSEASSNEPETAQPAPEQPIDKLQPSAKPSESKINFAKSKNDKLAPSKLAFNSKVSTEAQDYILENIVTALDQRRIDVDRLQINFDGQNIFKMNKGDIAHSTVSDRQTELIKQALNDPTSFKGSIKITNGSQVLLHVKDGQVLRDGLNLTKASTKVEISSAPGDLYDKHAKNVSSKGLKATKDIAVNALSAGVEKKQVKEIIQSKDAAYSNLQASSGKKSADKALDKIIASASAEVKLRRQSKQQSQSKQPALSRR